MATTAGAPAPEAAPKRAKLGKRPFPRDEEAGPSHAVDSSGPSGGRAGKRSPSVREMLRRCLERVGIADIGPNKGTFLGLIRIAELLPETEPWMPWKGEGAQPDSMVEDGSHIGYTYLEPLLSEWLAEGQEDNLNGCDDLEPLLSAWGDEGQEDNPNSAKFAAFRRIVARAMVVGRNITSFIKMEPSQSHKKRAAYKPDFLPNWIGKAIPGSKYDHRRPKAKQRFISPLDVALGNPRSFFCISVPRDGSEFLIRAYVYGCFGNFAYSLRLLQVKTFCDQQGKAILAAVPWAWGPERRPPSVSFDTRRGVLIREAVTVKLRTPTGEYLRPIADREHLNLGIGEEMRLLYIKVWKEKASSSPSTFIVR